MTYSTISRALVVGLLLAAACSSVAFADSAGKAEQGRDDSAVISEQQQREWELKMLSWQQNLAENLQEKVGNTLLLKSNIDYSQDLTVFAAELSADRERIVGK